MKRFCIVLIAGWFAVTGFAQLPFVETFDGLNAGSLSNQNDWVVNGSALVQTNDAQTGKAIQISGASVSHEIGNTNSTMWLTCWAKYTDLPGQNPVVATNTCLAFYINTNGNLVVFSNTTPVVLGVAIPTNLWARFDVYCDHDSGTWDLSVNKTNVCAGLPLYADNRQFSTVQIQNESTAAVYVDEISVADVEPATDIIDGDNDGIPDWWEQKYFGGIHAADANSLAENGVNTLGEVYLAGLSPLGTERFEVFSSLAGQLSWVGHPGRNYSVYWTTNLAAGFTLLQANIPWTQNEFTDEAGIAAPAGFYQLRVGP